MRSCLARSAVSTGSQRLGLNDDLQESLWLGCWSLVAFTVHKSPSFSHTRSLERSGMGAICEHNEPEEIVSRERSALHPDQFTGVLNLVRSSLTGYHVGAMFRILCGARHNDAAVWFRPISSSRFKVRRAFKPSRAHASQTTPRT